MSYNGGRRESVVEGFLFFMGGGRLRFWVWYFFLILKVDEG